MQWKQSPMIYWMWMSLAAPWPVFELWCFPGHQWFIVLDSVAYVLCLYSGVSLSLSTLVVVPQRKGWKMLALCFICLSGSDVPPQETLGIGSSSTPHRFVLLPPFFSFSAAFEQEPCLKLNVWGLLLDSCRGSSHHQAPARWSHDRVVSSTIVVWFAV